MSDEQAVKFLLDSKTVTLRGFDWGMVTATLEESANNCFRCNNEGCQVCDMTRLILKRIEKELLK